MIQNILIGVVAFGVAVYWVSCVERQSRRRAAEHHGDLAPLPAVRDWFRAGVACAFQFSTGRFRQGPELVDAMIDGSTGTLRGWLFCLAFVSIGLETNFRELSPYLRGGKPLTLYLCGQALNLCLSLLMSWFIFRVVFRDMV